MKKPLFRTLRFVHPDFARAGETVGLRTNLRGGIQMVELDESIRQSVLLLVTTVPGERVMRPEYGCYLYRLIFSPNDYTTAGLAIHYVKQAIDRWEPRIEVVRLDAGQNPDDPGRLDVLLEYRVRATQQMDRLTVSFNLTGEQP